MKKIKAFPDGSRHIFKNRHSGRESVFISSIGTKRGQKGKQFWETPGTGWGSSNMFMSLGGWEYCRPEPQNLDNN